MMTACESAEAEGGGGGEIASLPSSEPYGLSSKGDSVRSFLQHGNRSQDLSSTSTEFLASKQELGQVLNGGEGQVLVEGGPPASLRGYPAGEGDRSPGLKDQPAEDDWKTAASSPSTRMSPIERARKLLMSDKDSEDGEDRNSSGQATMRLWSYVQNDSDKERGGSGGGGYWDGIRSTIGLGRKTEEDNKWEKERDARGFTSGSPSKDPERRRNLAPRRRYSKDALNFADDDDYTYKPYDYAMEYTKEISDCCFTERVRAAVSSFCSEKCSDCAVACRRSCNGRYAPICVVLASLILAALTAAPILTGRANGANGHSHYQLTDAERYVVIRQRIIDTDLSLPADLPDSSDVGGANSTPQHRALEWISVKDPARIDPDDPALLQRYALAVFFHSTGGDQQGGDDGVLTIWDSSYNWLSGRDMCAWAGVSCHIHSGKTFAKEEGLTVENGNQATDLVRELNLTTNGLIGSIPREIIALRNLRLLDLSYNDIRGTLPEQVGELFQLVSLRLQGNRGFEGTIPPAIIQLSHLEELHLEQSKFRGKIPPDIGNIRNLKDMVLGENSLTGPLPDSIGKLWRLSLLHLNDNHLTGSIPPVIGQLENLLGLHLRKNQLTGSIPPSVLSAEHLEQIDLCNNRLNGTVPDAFDELSDLAYVELCDNQLSGPIPPSLAWLSNVIMIGFSGNQLTGPIPTVLGELGQLESLVLTGNNLTGTVPEEVCALPSLAILEADCWGEDAPIKCSCCRECK